MDNKSRDQCSRRELLSEFQPSESEHGDIEGATKPESGIEEMLCKKAQSRGSPLRSYLTEDEEDNSRGVDREAQQDDRGLKDSKCYPSFVLLMFPFFVLPFLLDFHILFCPLPVFTMKSVKKGRPKSVLIIGHRDLYDHIRMDGLRSHVPLRSFPPASVVVAFTSPLIGPSTIEAISLKKSQHNLFLPSFCDQGRIGGYATDNSHIICLADFLYICGINKKFHWFPSCISNNRNCWYFHSYKSSYKSILT